MAHLTNDIIQTTMLRKRERRASLLTMTTLLFSDLSSATDWSTSQNCLTSCTLNVSLCLVSRDDDECMALTEAETSGDWHVNLTSTQSYSFGTLHLPRQVQMLRLHGYKTRVLFDTSSVWMAEQLTALLFIGLDLTNTRLPKLPSSLRQLRIANCVLDQVPVLSLLSLPRLEHLVLTENTLMDETLPLMELSKQQFNLLSGRVRGNIFMEHKVGEAQLKACTDFRGGTVQDLNGWPVCVTSNDPSLVQRRLLSKDIGSGDGYPLNGNVSDSPSEHGTPTLVIVSFCIPFAFLLFKMLLFIFYIRADNRYIESRREVTRRKDLNLTILESEADRTTTDSTNSASAFTFPQVHRRQAKQPLYRNDAGFWVDEELQPWRLSFKRLKMLKCLSFQSTERRQTLRKQSVTSSMNRREIWLASLASEDTSAVVSPGGGTTNVLVVAKFVAPQESSSVACGSQSGTEKLRRELKRQAKFLHPQVVTFIGVAWSRETHLVAITEYMAQGDLRQWLQRTASKQSTCRHWSILKIKILLDVSRALLYLHSMCPHLVHGNCNSRNVLLDQSLHAKLSDFGIDGRSNGLTEQELTSYSAVGSGRWISPEALVGREASASYPDACDVYSFGILIAEMDSHDLPFSDLMQANRSAVPETDILHMIARGALSPTLSSTCPNSVVKLVNACTSYNPKYRPSSVQVHQDLIRILDEFEMENQTAMISFGAPKSNTPSNLV